MRARFAVPLVAVAVLGSLAGCDLPRDPDRTLERVRGGEVRIGIAYNPPFAAWNDGEPSGVEVELARKLAAELDATIAWTPGGEQELLEKLERRELDAVLAGITDKTPWRTRIGLTMPYLHVRDARGKTQNHVLAMPPGENGWIHRVDTFLYHHRDDAARLYDEAPARVQERAP